jgi:hypothetical protein
MIPITIPSQNIEMDMVFSFQYRPDPFVVVTGP